MGATPGGSPFLCITVQCIASFAVIAWSRLENRTSAMPLLAPVSRQVQTVDKTKGRGSQPGSLAAKSEPGFFLAAPGVCLGVPAQNRHSPQGGWFWVPVPADQAKFSLLKNGQFKVPGA